MRRQSQWHIIYESPGLASFINEKGDSGYNQHEGTQNSQKIVHVC